jgi:hypothetical protein
VKVSSVLEPSLGIHNGKVNDQVAIWLLGLLDHIHQLLNTVLELFGVL